MRINMFSDDKFPEEDLRPTILSVGKPSKNLIREGHSYSKEAFTSTIESSRAAMAPQFSRLQQFLNENTLTDEEDPDPDRSPRINIEQYSELEELNEPLKDYSIEAYDYSRIAD
jgi:hypothetical protein